MRRLRVTRVSIQAKSGEYIEVSSDDLRDIADEAAELIESEVLDDDNRDDGSDDDDDEGEDEDPEPEPDWGGRMRAIHPVAVRDN